MECRNCGNKEAFRMEITLNGEWCDVCGKVSSVWFPDVFFNGRPEETLADDVNGKPIVFNSRHEKALYLRSHGLYQAGDKLRGSFNEYDGRSKPIDKLKNREEVKRVMNIVKNMGKDYKRQEFLRLKKYAVEY